MDGDFAGLGCVAPALIDEADRQRLAAAIDEAELVELALALGNIPSPARHEKAAGDFVFDWLDKEGFSPRRVGCAYGQPGHAGLRPQRGGLRGAGGPPDRLRLGSDLGR